MAPPRVCLYRCLVRSPSTPPSLRRRICSTPVLRKAPRPQQPAGGANAQIEAAKLRLKQKSKFGMPKITFYEQDADRQSAPQKIESIETPEDLRRFQESTERATSLNIDDPNTRASVFKDLLKDPDLAGANTELRALRMDMLGGKWGPEEKELDLRMKRNVIMDLLQDPEMADAKEGLQQILTDLPNIEVGEEEFGEEDLKEEMEELEALQTGSLVEGMSDEELVDNLKHIGKDLENSEWKQEFQEYESAHEDESADMLRELREYEKSKGFKVKAGEEEFEDEKVGNKTEEFSDKDQESLPPGPNPEILSGTIEGVSPTVEETPINTDPNAILTIEERITLAQRDPEHRAALHRLALRPESDPAIKHLNAVLRTAYMGANEDVRKAIWRAYSRAKRVPGFLELIPNDAWDMIYYSQAVKWKGNQNRDQHMAILRRDLESLGMDGPPTPEEELE